MEGREKSGEDDQVLVAEYALGLLEGGERAAVARRIASEPVLAADLRLWRERLATLDREFVEERVPPQVLERIEGRLFREAVPAARGGWWNSLALWRGLTAAAAAVAAIAIGFSLLQPRVDPTELASQLVAALSEQGSNVSFVALYNPATGSVRLTALSGETVADRDYELWAIQGANAPVSMGVIPIDQRSDVRLPPLPEQFGEGTVLAITLEQKGGSPTGAPQGPIVARGTATVI